MIVLGWRGGLRLGEVLGLHPNLGDRDVTGNGKVGPGPGSPPEPPKLAAEIIGGYDAAGRPLRRSPVRDRSGRPPKTPRNGGKFTAGSRSGRGVSGGADYLAVGAVDRKPVSLPKSLIYRENTGNSPETGFRVGPDSPVRPLLGVLRGVFP